MDEQLRKAALNFHEFPNPGKIEVIATKSLTSQYDLSLAYSPGVAEPCLEIQKDPLDAYRYTSKGNLVGVISNGTAVLGLGNIGALAGKPVMEGKGVLFKKFAGINVFDIEVDETDPDKFIEVVAPLEPTFGGINLEDIKAPECFKIERELRKRMNIPVFHDDQHGTAIVCTAAIMNGLKVVNKKIDEVKVVCSGAGAAAIACLDLLVRLGIQRKNITVCDIDGVLYKGRENLDEYRLPYAIEDNGQRVLRDAIKDKDIFMGLSAPNLIDEEMLLSMASHPLILALANPNPEVSPDLVKKVRPDAIVCTGRSDYPNQVNNVLCFPFIFRGALDVGATTINEEMKIACVEAIAELAFAGIEESVSQTYNNQDLHFGPEYLIPKPFDPRLIVKIAPAVAKAAMDSGVAMHPIDDFDAYIENLSEFVYRSTHFMRPVFAQAKKDKKRIILCEGEDPRVLHATQQAIASGIAYPVLIGRPDVIQSKIDDLGLKIKIGVDFDLINNFDYPEYESFWQTYYDLTCRYGVSEEIARRKMTSNTTLIGAMMLRNNKADGLVCGTFGLYQKHFDALRQIIGYNSKDNIAAAVNALLLRDGCLFITDTYVNDVPDTEQLAKITLMAADVVQRFGITPRIALVSNSSFGSLDTETSKKMRDALKIIKEKAPNLEVDGEMQADAALVESLRLKSFPNSNLKGTANLLVMPSAEVANIAYNLLRITASNDVTVGPILTGLSKSAHIVTPISGARRILNMIALAAIGAENNVS